MMIVGICGGIESGKTTVAEHLVIEHGFQALAFADPLWAMLEVIGVDPEQIADRRYKDHHPLPHIGKTPRELIQTLGTEWGRQMVHPDLWVIIAQREIEKHKRLHGPIDRLVITDVRFDNEAEWIRSMGGKLWHIARPIVDRPRGHSSERGINPRYIHRGIVNDGTLDELHANVDKRVAELVKELAEVQS